MSSNDNYQNEGYPNQVWGRSFSEVTVPRPPSIATESRVLSKLRNDQAAAATTTPSTTTNTTTTTTTTTTPKPNSAFSNPPPSLNHHPLVNNSPQPVKQPEVPSQLSATVPSQLSATVHSQLSATAKEFVPSQVSYSNQECSPDAYSLSVTAAEFVPRVPDGFYSNADPYYPNLQYGSYGPDPSIILDDFNSLSLREPFDPYSAHVVPSDTTGNSILARFNHALKVLNLNPGNMEEYLRPICEKIQGSSDTTGIVNDVIESLFEQSIQESNFRYTGARIFQFLKSKLEGNPYFSGFHEIFIKRCQKEYDKRNDLKNGTPADQERLRGLSMFLAEIFLNVQAETEDGSVQRLNFLPVILVELVKTLLSTPSDVDVKCSCQLLKLAGSLIDDKVKNSSEECIKFEEIFAQLKPLQSNSQLTENAKFLIGSVLNLKDADWNRSSSSPPKKSLHSFTSETNNFKVPEPVFYNLLGAPCSRTEAGLSEEEDEDGAYVLNDEEEAAFLEWQAEQDAQIGDNEAWCSNDTSYGSYQFFGDEAADDGGMGDEMEAAYEEFLQKQTFLHGYQPPKQPMPNMHPQQEFVGYPHQQPQMRPQNLQQNRLPHLQDQQLHLVSSNSQHQMRHQIPQQNRLPHHQNHQQPRMLPPNPQPQPHLPPNPQQNQLQDQQQQYQPNFHKNDRFHFHR